MAGKKLRVEDRQDIFDLVAQYCHRVDHADGEGVAALFTSDGAFDIKGITRLEGTEQLRGMPAVVSEQGNGTWRHQVTNIIAEAGDAPDTATMMAYGLVTGWVSGGVPITFTAYSGRLRRVDGALRLATMIATSVWGPPALQGHRRLRPLGALCA